MLLKEPSQWSSETFNRTSIMAFFIVKGIAYFALAILALFFPEAESSELTLLGAALIWIIGILLLIRNRWKVI